MPLEMRVYGLEGIVDTQDEAITRHAITLAEHDARLGSHDVQLAVTTTSQAAMQKSLDAVVAELVKTRWTLVAAVLAALGGAIGFH